MNYQVNQARLAAAIEKYHQAATDLSDDLAANPEISDQEFETSRKMVQLLQDNGFSVTYPFAGYPTGFCATMNNGEGAKVAIMAEYDALPEIGHACGHNVHGCMSILSGLAFAELKDSFQGTLYLIGTPAEEENGAKIGMAANGVFDEMDLAIMVHSGPAGVCQTEMDALSLRCYEIEFHGKSAHAVAGPWAGHSALAAARKFLDLIDARRECFTPDMKVNAIIKQGGNAPNIIPDFAKLRLEFRTDSMAKLELADEMIHKCANGAAMALDCTVSWEKGFDDFADMVRIPALEEKAHEVLTALGETVIDIQPPVGSSDVGNVSYRCPTIQPLIGITKENFALHTIEFAQETTKPYAHRAMAIGAQMISSLCLCVFNDKAFRDTLHAQLEMQKAKKMRI